MEEKDKKRKIIFIAVIVLLVIFMVYFIYSQIRPVRVEYGKEESDRYITINFGSSKIIFPLDFKNPTER